MEGGSLPLRRRAPCLPSARRVPPLPATAQLHPCFSGRGREQGNILTQRPSGLVCRERQERHAGRCPAPRRGSVPSCPRRCLGDMPAPGKGTRGGLCRKAGAIPGEKGRGKAARERRGGFLRDAPFLLARNLMFLPRSPGMPGKVIPRQVGVPEPPRRAASRRGAGRKGRASARLRCGIFILRRSLGKAGQLPGAGPRRSCSPPGTVACPASVQACAAAPACRGRLFSGLRRKTEKGEEAGAGGATPLRTGKSLPCRREVPALGFRGNTPCLSPLPAVFRSCLQRRSFIPVFPAAAGSKGICLPSGRISREGVFRAQAAHPAGNRPSPMNRENPHVGQPHARGLAFQAFAREKYARTSSAFASRPPCATLSQTGGKTCTK